MKKCIWCKEDKDLSEFYAHKDCSDGLLNKCKICCRIYSVWKKIMERCYFQHTKDYKHYGARGIKVCDEWHNHAVFMEWYAERFIDGYHIDRIDNDGPYSPDNCQIVSPRENMRKRTTCKLDVEKLSKIDLMVCSGMRLFEIANEMDISRTTIASALKGQSWSDYQWSDFTKQKYQGVQYDEKDRIWNN
jgi:hypothetical protein